MIETLSKSEAAILQLLNGSPEKAASHKRVRQHAKLTLRGYTTVRHRMMDKNLIAWADGTASIQITFGGLRASGAV